MAMMATEPGPADLAEAERWIATLRRAYHRERDYTKRLEAELRRQRIKVDASDLLLHWCIIGGESGPGARPFCVAWAHRLIDQCRAAGVAVFVKQLGAKPRDGHGFPFDWLKDGGHHGDVSEWPEDLRVREFPERAREAAPA